MYSEKKKRKTIVSKEEVKRVQIKNLLLKISSTTTKMPLVLIKIYIPSSGMFHVLQEDSRSYLAPALPFKNKNSSGYLGSNLQIFNSCLI